MANGHPGKRQCMENTYGCDSQETCCYFGARLAHTVYMLLWCDCIEALKRILLFILLTAQFTAHFRGVEYISIAWKFAKTCSKSGQWSGFQLIVESNWFLLRFCSATLCDWLVKLAPLFPPMTNQNQP